jgi:hypothetical protein
MYFIVLLQKAAYLWQGGTAIECLLYNHFGLPTIAVPYGVGNVVVQSNVVNVLFHSLLD